MGVPWCYDVAVWAATRWHRTCCLRTCGGYAKDECRCFMVAYEGAVLLLFATCMGCAVSTVTTWGREGVSARCFRQLWLK